MTKLQTEQKGVHVCIYPINAFTTVYKHFINCKLIVSIVNSVVMYCMKHCSHRTHFQAKKILVTNLKMSKI